MNLLISMVVAGLLDVVTAPGTYFEMLRVPGINTRLCLSRPCTSLVYEFRYPERSCLMPIRATVLSTGAVVPSKIDEVGLPGERGYTWSLSTTKLFHGGAIVLIDIEDVCHNKT